MGAEAGQNIDAAEAQGNFMENNNRKCVELEAFAGELDDPRTGQLLILYCVQLLIRRRQALASPDFDAVLRTRATRPPSI